MDSREANIIVHSKMAASYDAREPHFRAENQNKVRKVLERLRVEHGGRLLDIGCGTGFIIRLAADLFDEVWGIDVTRAMLALVPNSSGNVHTCEADASSLPFQSASFDVVSAYSFLHHLKEMEPVLAEAFRVLQPGGCLYVDLEPNRLFWENITAIKDVTTAATSRLVLDEIDSVCRTDQKVAETFDIAPDVFNLAEYNKALTGGIDPDMFSALLEATGFEDVRTSFEWFAGQGKILHGISASAADTIDAYLRQALPLSRGLYKYLRFVAVKP
jgi:ubiquinone/menaquinone biosynthesis C-methylase UbiE